MTMEDNKAIARRLTDAYNRGDYAAMRDVMAPDFVAHIADWPRPLARDAYLAGAEMGRRAFGDLNFAIEDVIAEGDKVVLRVIAHGTHTGEYQGIAPSGRRVVWAGISIRRISGTQVAEEWQVNDQLSLREQLQAPH